MKIKEIINFFKKYFKTEKKLFIKAFILIFISSLAGIVYGYLMGLAIDKASLGLFMDSSIVLIIYFVLGILDNMIFDRLGRIYIEQISINMMEKIGFEVYSKVGVLPARAFEEKSSGELINRITNDSQTITETFKSLLRTIVALWTALVVLIYICFNSLIVTFEILIYIFLFYLFSKKYLPKIKENQKSITKEKDKAVATVNENIRGIREIKALGIRKSMNKSVKSIIHEIYAKSKDQMQNERTYYALVYSINTVLEVSVFITCIVLIYFDKSSFSFFMAMTYYIYRFMRTVDEITNLSTSYQKMKVAIERLDEILNNKLYQDEFFGTLNKTDIIGNIAFKDVTFQYSNEEKPIFKKLYLSLPSHQKIAIVGKSGQGKTSIFNLLLRYFEPNEGEITIDGIPIKDFTEDAFRQNIAIIRQDPFLFNKTIFENFTVLNKNLDINQIREACKTAEIDDYVMSLPEKYNTIIGEGGVNLSGGQKQRIAIARALLKNSKILLFDEATSALDNESQGKIKKAMDNLVKDHTIIIVAHRLSTIIDADVIHIVDKGRIAASGTHEKLLAKNSIYKSLYNNES